MCINMINMKLTEDFVLFRNANDFESKEIFDFIILLQSFYFFLCWFFLNHFLVLFLFFYFL